MKKILIADDERQITRALRTALRSHGFDVTTAADGAEALRILKASPPDLLITDLSMPHLDGVALTKAVREMSDIPIIVLSVREQEATKILALDSGADDYITKPFSVPELLARVRAHLRRGTESENAPMLIDEGDIVIDIEAHTVLVRNRETHLTPKEFDLLVLLARNSGRVMTHRALLRGVWGAAGEDQPDYLRVLVAQLRKKIDLLDQSSYVESEPWVGYRFRAAPANSTDS